MLKGEPISSVGWPGAGRRKIANRFYRDSRFTHRGPILPAFSDRQMTTRVLFVSFSRQGGT